MHGSKPLEPPVILTSSKLLIKTCSPALMTGSTGPPDWLPSGSGTRDYFCLTGPGGDWVCHLVLVPPHPVITGALAWFFTGSLTWYL